MTNDIEKLVVLGPPGSYLDGLASSMELDCPVAYGSTFPEMIAKAEQSPATAVLLPIKNTLKGTLNDVVGAFQNRNLRVEGAAKLNVVSNIMGLGTLEEAHSIGGKDVALEQITSFMPHLDRIEMASTSAAGQYIHEAKDRTMLSVGALAQADLYDLDVLARGVQDAEGINRTTVLMARGRNGWKFDPDTLDSYVNSSGTMLMRVNDSDRAGSLYRAMGEMADRQINLTNIESLTIRGTELSEFFVTLSGTGVAIRDLLKSKKVAAHMSLDVLGIYEEPCIYDS